MPIENVDDLRAHVALATRVELSTIPPYLYALYSIKDHESEPARLMASIVVEEMLHLCLTSNLLLALGGEPAFAGLQGPGYPTLLAHHKPELRLELKAMTVDLVRDMFMGIERPQPTDAFPEDDDFETLGQFYRALEGALDTVGSTTDLFADPQRARQLANPAFYGPVDFDAEDSGTLMLIDDAASARSALEVVIHQGEGVGHDRWADPGHLELTHYYKLERLASGAVAIGPVWPVLDNPRTADFPAGVQEVSNLFNALFALTLITMDELFSGHGDQDAGIGALYGLMTHGLEPTARYLVQLPVDANRTAGPTFERYEFGDDPREHTARLAAAVAASHPRLDAVATHLAVRT